MKKILAVGCSMTRGHGLLREETDDKLWVNQIFKDIGHVKNISKTGANNQWIFLETASTLLKEEFDIVVVGWSATPRYTINVGLELYSTQTNLRNHDVNINPGITFKGPWLEKLGDNLNLLHNDHWDILNLIQYVNILIRLQETNVTKKIFFVNTLSPWSDHFFEYKELSSPSPLSEYEKNLLNVEHRDAHEIISLYKMIHTQYRNYGGIQEDHWLNLYNSLRSMQIDRVSPEDYHPGYASQDLYASQFTPILKTKIKN